jgi:hypothetical protein
MTGVWYWAVWWCSFCVLVVMVSSAVVRRYRFDFDIGIALLLTALVLVVVFMPLAAAYGVFH